MENEIDKEIIAGGDYATLPNGHVIIKTTFPTDFQIAQKIGGEQAIKDTYKRSFDSFKDDIRYLTAMVLSLNWNGHSCYDEGDKALAMVYFNLQHELDSYILQGESDGEKWKSINFNEKEVRYYLAATD